MSNFLSAPDPIQQAAITALQAAIDAEPDRVYAHVMAEHLLAHWMRQHDLIAWPLPASHPPCAGFLLRRHRHDPYGRRGICGLPGCDHTSLWAHPGEERPRVFVTQPYSLELPDMLAMARKCTRYRLDLSIEPGPSWHFPGSTMAIIITRAGERP